MSGSVARRLLSISTVIAAWAIITLLTDLTSVNFLPSPVDLARSYWDMRDNLGSAIQVSLGITLSGFAIGLILGVGLGLAIAYNKTFMDILGPFMEFTRPVPIFALIPLFLLWFGIGLWPQILLVALGVSTILGVATHEAVRNVPIIYIRAALNLGANKATIFRTIIVPCIFPHLIGAIRVAAAASWGLDVAAEFMGVQAGLGFNMIVQQTYLSTPGIIAIAVIYSLLAIILDQIIAAVETRLTVWTDRSKIAYGDI